MHAPRRSLSAATLTGLFVALALPFLSYAVSRPLFGEGQSITRVIVGLVVHWASFLIVLGIVRGWEQQPFASIGVQRLRWWTIPAGIVAGFIIATASAMIVGALKLPANTQDVMYLQSLPFVLRLLLVVTAGVFEETMYRGYGLERLTTLFGSKWLAGLVTLVLFTLAHAPAFGLRNLLPIAVVSVFVTLLYLWRRDLILNMVMHASIDALGLLVAPAMSTPS